MQYDITHLLREPVGFRWDVDVDEVGTAEPVKGERIQGQLRLTRFSQGVCAEAHLSTEAVQICDRCLRTFRQPGHAEFTELCRTAEPTPSSHGIRMNYSWTAAAFLTWERFSDNISF